MTGVIPKNFRSESVIFSKEKIHGGAVRQFERAFHAEVRHVISALLEVLVARGAFLTVPPLFVHEHNGGEDSETIDRKCDVSQLGAGALSVMEAKRTAQLL